MKSFLTFETRSALDRASFNRVSVDLLIPNEIEKDKEESLCISREFFVISCNNEIDFLLVGHDNVYRSAYFAALTYYSL
jgi:hypothetical protein